MPFPKTFVRFTWQFQIIGTDEIADTGLKLSVLSGAFDANSFVAATTDAQMQNYAGYLHVAMTTASTIKWAAYSTMTSVKMAACDVNGKYTSAPKISAVTGVTGDASDVPPQLSTVISLRSGTTFGTANYGRMYLPHTTFATGTSYQGTTTQATNLATAGATFIGSMNIQSGLIRSDTVVVNMSSVGAGTMKAVSKIGAGRLVDTQRRRRNALAEGTIFANV